MASSAWPPFEPVYGKDDPMVKNPNYFEPVTV
jgi:hypothetical protein